MITDGMETSMQDILVGILLGVVWSCFAAGVSWASYKIIERICK